MFCRLPCRRVASLGRPPHASLPPTQLFLPSTQLRLRRAYFLRPALFTPAIEKVLQDPQLASLVLGRLKTTSTLAQDDFLHGLFASALERASAVDADVAAAAYRFLLDAWHAVFFQTRNLALQRRFAHDEHRLVHAMINRGDHARYKALVAPVKAAEPSWARRVMETLQPTRTNGVLSFQRGLVLAFLTLAPPRERHRMLAIAMAKKTLYSEPLDRVLLATLRGFNELYSAAGRKPFSLENPDHEPYGKALRLMFTRQTPELMERLLGAIADVVSRDLFPNLLSAILQVVARTNPQVTLACWQYKVQHHVTQRTPRDLTNAMLAHIELRAYDKALRLYLANVSLQRDEQILLLLQISERNKDWKLLQKQFEDMYGRGNLPYLVHYAVVMGALASLGATHEVEQLYNQLLKRNLVPSAPVFLALVRVNINANKADAARAWYAKFLEFVDSGAIPKSNIPSVQLEILKISLFQSDVPLAMSEFRNLVDTQTPDTPLIDSETIRTMIRFTLATYAISEFNKVWELATKLDLVDESTYCSAIHFLTRTGQFERADELSYEAQANSVVPFQSNLIMAAQLRNYTIWFKEATDPALKKSLYQRVENILRVAKGPVSPKGLDALLAEIISYAANAGNLERARHFLKLAQTLDIASERHYIPLLKEFSTEGSYSENSDVLELYRQMVEGKMVLGAKTYLYLARSLFKIDASKKGSFQNSYNLLLSVLEMYGFSFDSAAKPKTASSSVLAKNAVPLLKIVSEYVIATAGDGNMALVVDFLNQLRDKLDKRIDLDLRIAILDQMSHVYYAYQDLELSLRLVENALSELHDIVDQIETRPLPKMLQLQYRRIIETKLRILKASNAPNARFEEILKTAISRDVRLSGRQLHDINERLLAEPTWEVLETVLDSCERYLVAGNYLEVKISRKIFHIYRIYVALLSRKMLVESIAQRFSILNRFYELDVPAVVGEMHGTDPYHILEAELEELCVLSRDKWTVARLVENMAEFFTPERRSKTDNFIRPNIASRLVACVETLCAGDKTLAFLLYDKFPEVMDYLLFFIGERARVTRFRSDIAEIRGVRASSTDARAVRRQQSIEALQLVGI